MSRIKTILLWVMGLAYVAVGVNHFVMPATYEAIMPPYLPWHRELVWISGAAEIALGILVLVPKTRVLAAWGLVALLIAVFPANLHMALNPADFDIPRWVLYLRLPLQGLFIAWALWYTRAEPDVAASRTD